MVRELAKRFTNENTNDWRPTDHHRFHVYLCVRAKAGGLWVVLVEKQQTPCGSFNECPYTFSYSLSLWSHYKNKSTTHLHCVVYVVRLRAFVSINEV